ncbi:MAG: hypothetical protein QM757_01900 [Paludibaculum sp.]
MAGFDRMMMRRRNHGHMGAGPFACQNAGRHVFEHQAIGRVETEALGAEDVAIRSRLAPRHVVGGDDDGAAAEYRLRQGGAGQAATGADVTMPQRPAGRADRKSIAPAMGTTPSTSSISALLDLLCFGNRIDAGQVELA